MKPFVKTLLIGGGTIGLGFIGYKVYKNLIEKNTTSGNTTSGNTNSGGGLVGGTDASLPPCERSASFPIKVGSVGKQVKEIQKFVNKFGNAGISEDCKYGQITDSRVLNLFRTKNISYDGGVSKSVYDSVIVPSLRQGKIVTGNILTDTLSWLKG